MSVKNNQKGFSSVVIVLAIVVVGVVGVVAWRVTDTKTTNQQIDTTQTESLSAADEAILTQAKELKKVDFDLDGTVNSKDNDDDNDGQNDNVDNNDDNDGELDNVDNDQDNDGTTDDKDDEAAQQADLQEGNQGQNE